MTECPYCAPEPCYAAISQAKAPQVGAESGVVRMTVWHYGYSTQAWGVVEAPTLASARRLIRERFNVRSTRGMWIVANEEPGGKWRIRDYQGVG